MATKRLKFIAILVFYLSLFTLKIQSVQALRALAVILVVYAHAIGFENNIHLKSSSQAEFFHLKAWGGIGVDLFFVISGFIMYHIAPHYKSYKTFALKRIARIIPFYWLVSFFQFYIRYKQQNLTANSILQTFIFIPVSDNSGLPLNTVLLEKIMFTHLVGIEE